MAHSAIDMAASSSHPSTCTCANANANNKADTNKRIRIVLTCTLIPILVLFVLYRREVWEWGGALDIGKGLPNHPQSPHAHGRYCRLTTPHIENSDDTTKKTPTTTPSISQVNATRRAPFTRRIIAVGDIHGDMQNAIKVLRFAGVITTDDKDNDERGHPKWTGNVDWLVQTGDMIDRGDDTIPLYAWMESLRAQAKSVGGDIISHLGNHEYMNVLGDWRYVYPSELKTFHSIAERQRMLSTGPIGRAWAQNYTVTSRVPLHPSIGGINEPYEPPSPQPSQDANQIAFTASPNTNPPSPLSHTAVSFVHGGLSPNYTGLTPFPSKINSLGKSLLAKLQSRKPPAPYPPGKYPGLPSDATPEERALYATNGPLWYRGWAMKSEEEVCSEVDDVLDRTGTRRMVIGHTPDFERIVSRCGGKIIIIDTEESSIRILIINPNSSASVTSGLKDILVPPPATYLNFYTAPIIAPAQIMDLTTGIQTASICFDDLKKKGLIDQYDAFLVCCFSDHPLTHILREHTPKPVINILEAAISHSLLIGQRFGIITTGSGYKYIYHKDVKNFMGNTSDRFAGLVASGLGVVELREGVREDVERKVKDAARRVAEMGADVIILGCAGMAGMEDLVRSAVAEAGHQPVKVVDGAKAGVQLLPALARLNQ
ncbi:hypothetical protein CVT24_000091 [Panaeolus cyanescens]|uniref:Calcineurin-like phosphoesterase domain-containing protein n=1 Tax=Panaeolus cyanescens TaxID=181874 RepID=A0A409VS54_9AGAR|nr:hypothetical protein CVT24_000091 [Panaeolus cyanescens]